MPFASGFAAYDAEYSRVIRDTIVVLASIFLSRSDKEYNIILCTPGLLCYSVMYASHSLIRSIVIVPENEFSTCNAIHISG